MSDHPGGNSAALHFDSLPLLLSTKEVAGVIDRKTKFVRELIDAGQLETHADSAFGKRTTNRITRRSVVLYFIKTPLCDASHFVGAWEQLLSDLSNNQLQHFIVAATRHAGRSCRVV
jgi:hypothetical protein